LREIATKQKKQDLMEIGIFCLFEIGEKFQEENIHLSVKKASLENPFEHLKLQKHDKQLFLLLQSI